MLNDQNYYIIKVYTGMRRGAGTRSRVAFILTGSKGSTGPRELYDGVREVILAFTYCVIKLLSVIKHNLSAFAYLYFVNISFIYS